MMTTKEESIIETLLACEFESALLGGGGMVLKSVPYDLAV